jgi:hypothetical protein
MKPSTKKPVSNKTASAPVVKPEQVVVEPVETSNEHPIAEVVEEEVVQGEKAEPEAEDESTPPPVEAQPTPLPPEPASERADKAVKVTLGSVECTLRRMPLAMVQKALIKIHQDRVELMRTDRSIRDLQDRMRASDGRCAPVVFTYDPEDKTIPPSMFAGIDNIAAAINVGLEEVSVLLVANADAAAVQSYLIVKGREKPASAEEDFLQRVQSHYDD